MTLEEAKAEILRLNEELATANNSIENLTGQVANLEADNNKIREINQAYFLKLSAQYKPPVDDGDGDDGDDEQPTLEEFAKNLHY